MPGEAQRCSQWDGQQCRATKKLTACAVKVEQGTFLKAPEKVVIYLCRKHFKMEWARPAAVEESTKKEGQ